MAEQSVAASYFFALSSSTEKTLTGETSIPEDAHQQAKARATYASFGDGGITATANAYGHLLQITRFFENEPSCFVCVDLDGMPPASSISERAAALQSNIDAPDKGMRLLIQDSNGHKAWEADKKLPKLKFKHDRWPCFITATKDFDLTIEYFSKGDTVYQIYEYKFKKASEEFPDLPTLTISNNLLLRDLDFLRKNNNQTVNPTQENNECVSLHKLNQDGQPTASLSIRSFINGSPRPFKVISDTTYQIIPDAKINQHRDNRRIQITLAYTLELISRNNDDTTPPSLTPKDRGSLEQIVDIPFDIPSFTTDKHLNFTLRRNLEHILSVCSIPIHDPSDGVPFIALTCGDISGHRIATAASFYAYQFLLKALKYFHDKRTCTCTFQKSFCGDHGCGMRSRIWRVCFGHLKWVYAKMEAQSDGNKEFIPPHHWANGKVIAKQHSLLRGRSLTDTPFHIIKGADFCQEFGNETISGDRKVCDSVAKGFQTIIKNWVKELDERNKSGKYAFPHFREKPTHIFYFSDHALIWRAAKAVESLGLASELCINNNSSSTSYSSTKIQSNIISRFTTTEDSSKRRMLAVSRGPSENMFLFQPEDTVLFDAMDMGLFDKPGMAVAESNIWINKIDVWRSIVDCQVKHEDNQDVHWVYPLQFALALMLSARNKGVNSRPATEMYIYSKWILFGSSSANGLFPGHLDENKEPDIVSDESKSEQYWYTTFEVPYILWRYDNLPSQAEQKEKTDSLQPTMNTEKAVIQTLSKISQMLEDILNNNSVASSANEDVFLKRNMPFNNIIDQKNISILSDEWLFNEPEFFDHKCTVSTELVERFCHKLKSRKRADIMMRHIAGKSNHKDKIDGYIVDVRKTKHYQKNDKPENVAICSNVALYKYLSEKHRTRETAKKRFFHFADANPHTAVACYLASSEKEEIALFFNRHASYDKYFNEEITPVLNKWVTELHLSFYQIITNDSPIVSSIPKLDKIELPRLYIKDEPKWIARVIMSFRFDGDFFDRYWTCHFFEFDPHGLKKAYGTRDMTVVPMANGASKSNPWKQRQVLELILVDHMLTQMITSTKRIVKDVKKGIMRHSLEPESVQPAGIISVVSDPLRLFADVNSNNVVDSTRQIWRQFQHLLQGVEDDLGENLVKIGYWRDREKEREQNKPRWTLNDERRYRGIISKLLTSIIQKIHELEQYNTEIISFKTSLIKRLEIAQEEWETRNTNNIRLFTYVTVVFLPISFATGVFSMSSAPTKETLSSMITTAGLALLVTIIVLLNARVLETEAFRPFFYIFRSISETVFLLALRIPGYIFRLIYLILLSLLSILPGKYIDALDVYLFDPVNELTKNVRSEQKMFQEINIADFFGHKINVKKMEIRRKSRKGEPATSGEERRPTVRPYQPERDSAPEGGRTGTSSENTVALTNNEVKLISKLMDWIKGLFGLGKNNFSTSNV